jgi:hypothetical protein
MDHISSTFGALLIGSLVAVCLSGVVTVQSFVYMKLYSNDATPTKSIVGVVWSLDTLHTGFVCASVWYYLIESFGEVDRINNIPWSLALTIAITAILTFLVHCFFVHRIYKLSNNRWHFAGPIAVLAFFRLMAACVTTSEMMRIKTFSGFAAQFKWVFTLGLALSSAVDIGITGILCYKLRSSRTTSSSMNQILDSLVIYTFENGSLTSAATVISMMCWLLMPHNRIFLGIHFGIGKLYANSLLATLITRKRFRRGRASMSQNALPVVFSTDFEAATPSHSHLTLGHISRIVSFRSTFDRTKTKKPANLQINVQREFETTFDEDKGQSSVMLPSPTTSTEPPASQCAV